MAELSAYLPTSESLLQVVSPINSYNSLLYSGLPVFTYIKIKLVIVKRFRVLYCTLCSGNLNSLTVRLYNQFDSSVI